MPQRGEKHTPRALDSVLGHQSEFPTVSLVFATPITRFQVLFYFVFNKSGDIAQAKYSRCIPEKWNSSICLNTSSTKNWFVAWHREGNCWLNESINDE